MKKLTSFILVILLSSSFLSIKAQSFIKIDASFYSELLDEVKNIDIYLPPDYYVNSEMEYATIYYLHGMGGDQNTGNTTAMLYYNFHTEDTTISSPPAIFVCLDASCEPYLGSYYMNSELYGPYEDYVMQDVIGFIESNFRALQDKNFRFITGWSMGGWGATRFSVKYPDQFRACVPGIGYLSMPDTMMNYWKNVCYQENNSYNLDYDAGSSTKQFFTATGGLSPNMDINPYHIEIPFDTLGNWVDTTLNKWHAEDPSRKVKELPDEKELSWFLICGTQDEKITFPTYQVFTDSLEAYNIGYDFNYFEGGHDFDTESWLIAIHWLDSIIELSYETLGIELTSHSCDNFTIYPNPSVDKIKIDFVTHTNGVVQIALLDQFGKQLSIIQNRKLPAGTYSMECIMQKYPSGIYFCRLKAGNEMITKKIIKL